jgi:L-ascorbate metabolism protein UlaG (beta-lactamase superfamily)
MLRLILLAGMFAVVLTSSASAQMDFEIDSIKTDSGDLEITFIGHGTLMFVHDGKTIHVDPWSKLVDYSKLPKADIVLITHHHRDHLDLKALEQVRAESSLVILTEACESQVAGGLVMNNGDAKTVPGYKIEAVPAYNLAHMRSEGIPFHPKGEGNGYVVTFGGKRVYVAGDTENIPEMKELKDIDIAFLPMNLPYTMTPEMVSDAAKAFKPKILYPYHYGSTDASEIVELLRGEDEIEVVERQRIWDRSGS